MIARTFLFALFLVLTPSTSSAFRPPENPTGLTGMPSVTTKSSTKVAPTKNIITPETMEGVIKAATAETHARELTLRKRWELGIDNKAPDYEEEYWFNPTIHNFGNIGFLGSIHAVLAPVSTKIIDVLAYDGDNIRNRVARKLSRMVRARAIRTGKSPRVLDMCCGVGISTRALQDAFPESEMVVGVDTSLEMINVAGFLTNHVAFIKNVASMLPIKNGAEETIKVPAGQKFPRKAKFTIANAERTNFPSQSFDLVTVMYAFHEAPHSGREKILKEAHRVLAPGGTLAVVDISTEYTPSKTMLSGEPYVLEYQKNIHRQMRSIRGFSSVSYRTLVKNHVGMWTLRRGN